MFYFFTIYKSEFYTGDWETLAYDWDIEEVVRLENMIGMYQDMKDAAEADHMAEEARKDAAKATKLPL